MNNPFLATTALEQFWDTTKPIVFLGEWCRRFSRKEKWSGLDHVCLPPLWVDEPQKSEAYAYVERVYEKYLPIIGKALNALHGRIHNERYWRILVGPWLLHYIHILYDRYSAVAKAIEQYPDFSTMGLAKECHVIPNDTLDFIELAADDPYNLQLYTNILTAMGRDIVLAKSDIERKSLFAGTNTKSIRYVLSNRLKTLSAGVCLVLRSDSIIALCNSYFTKTDQLKLLFKSGLRVRPYYKRVRAAPIRPADDSLRRSLVFDVEAIDEFEAIVAAMISDAMPRSLVETYHLIESTVCNEYPQGFSAISSAASWYFDEYFKMWAAREAERGVKLIGIQHGGNYGIDANCQMETHELKITDYYCSWGWEAASSGSRILPIGATKLQCGKRAASDGDDATVLYVAAGAPRYLYRFHNMNSSEYPLYIEWQLRFMRALSDAMRSHLRVRLYRNDYGWDMKERLLDQHPELAIENWSVPFLKRLKRCRVCVIDGLSTTYAEALSLNRPTIMFWDPRMFQVRDEAKPYFKGLSDSEVLHESPESAAHALRAMYDDVDSWWNERKRQQAIAIFCDKFARTSPNTVSSWAKEIIRCVS